jgi:hypothetical protein
MAKVFFGHFFLYSLAKFLVTKSARAVKMCWPSAWQLVPNGSGRFKPPLKSTALKPAYESSASVSNCMVDRSEPATEITLDIIEKWLPQ